MDFNSESGGLVAPMPPPKLAPAGEPTDDMLVTEPVLGPAEHSGPSTPNPMNVQPSDLGPSLAETLNWKVPGPRSPRQAL
jgi:hypothetical protein